MLLHSAALTKPEKRRILTQGSCAGKERGLGTVPEQIVRRRLRYFGIVPGVGFRYLARHAAAAVGATGWVRNEPDGSVTMELQGTRVQLAAVRAALERGRYVRIEAVEEQIIAPREDERGFSSRGEAWEYD